MDVALVVMVVLLFCSVGGTSVYANKRNVEPKETREFVHKETIETEDGEYIDCVDIQNQLAFDLPLLKNHTIQLKPNNIQRSTIPVESRPDSSLKSTQMWQRSGSCPDGTIPIRRIQGVQNNKMKLSSTIMTHDIQKSSDILSASSEGKHSFVMFLATEGNYLGAQAAMSVWNPSVEADDEYSSSKISLVDDPDNILESIEVGWMVNPSLYGDRQTRLFSFWTNDGQNENGCFDLHCSGFVQTSQEVALGMPINSSEAQGEQYEMTAFVYKDMHTQNWWFEWNSIPVGYWPFELFAALRKSPKAVAFGGDVYSPRMGLKPHTSTDMGSGQFANARDLGASYIRPMVVNSSADLMYPKRASTTVGSESTCYSKELVADMYEDLTFYFGGPGQNSFCK